MNDSITVKTNNVPRELIMGQYLDGFGSLRPDSLYHQLRNEFDYLSEEEFDNTEFFKFKGQWYSLDQFLRISQNTNFKGWDGIHSDSFFSGVVIKLNYPEVVVGTFCS